MGLFARRHLGREGVEARLKRKVSGDPSRGELAVLMALGRDDLEGARVKLAGADIGADFRSLIEPTLRSRPTRADGLKYVSIGVPLPTWHVYAKEARLTARLPSECLADAIERDRILRSDAADIAGGLERHMREFVESAREVLNEMRTVADARVAPPRAAVSPTSAAEARALRVEVALALTAALKQTARGLGEDLERRIAHSQALLIELSKG